MLNEWLGVDWRQQDKTLLVRKYAAAKQAMVRKRVDGFNAKCRAFFLSEAVSFFIFLLTCLSIIINQSSPFGWGYIFVNYQ